jgi:photosystem II stability/assembly factor-like uncharacterized protein
MARHVTQPTPLGALGVGAIVVLLLAGGGTTLDAQSKSSSASRSALKGIWEPVSYPEDIYLNGVFFVNPDVGWVTSGTVDEGGMLLRTRDGGANWEVQLGDHESKDPPFRSPYFLDELVGWVLQPTGVGKFKLLRTTDGESWQQVGAIQTDWGLQDYVFTSKNVGIYVDGNDNRGRIVRTTDGGRTWKDVFQCRAKIVVDGLSRDVNCNLKALHFPTPEVGYAIGGAHDAKRMLFVAKTEDGGNRWALTVVPDVGGDLEVYHNQELFFTDANTGFAHLAENRLYSTTDGGQTWNGLVGTPGTDIKFADPEVGWSFAGSRLTYTTDGGRRWSSRDLSFPAEVKDFSLPRRNRGYVVGEHGMIFRYTVVPEAEPTAASVVEAPAMPTFESQLDDQVTTVEAQVETLESQIESAASSAADTALIVNSCCTQSVNNLQATVDALTPLVPQFLRKYRNVNLILAGLQFLGILPDHLSQVKTALKTLRQARGPTATAAALTQLSTAIDVLSATTRQAFQKDPMRYRGADVGFAPSSAAAAASTTPSDATADVPAEPASDSTAVGEAEAEAKRRLADEAKKKAKDEVKKRVKIRFP